MEPKFKVGDRVVGTYDGNTQEEGVVNFVSISPNMPTQSRHTYTVAVEGSKYTSLYYEFELTALAVDERAELVEAYNAATVAESVAAKAKRAAQADYTRRVEATGAAARALNAYDDAHREPTFSEKLDALSIGAVFERNGNTFVKAGPNLFVRQYDLARFGAVDFGKWGDDVKIISEGVAK